jgi:outer membrane protein
MPKTICEELKSKERYEYKMITSVAILLAALSAARAQQHAYTLDECIDYAISHNINVQERALAISQQEIALNTSKNAWLPDLNLDMSQMFGFNNPGAASGNGSVSLAEDGSATTGSVRASMPLFDGFRIKNQIQADRFSLMSATANLEAAKKDISIQVAAYYLQCLYYKGMADVSRKQVETSREMVRRAAILVEEGKRPRSEQADAEAQLALDEHTLTNDEGQYTLSLLTLAHALNMPDIEGFRIVEDEQALGLSSDATLQMPQTIYESTVDSWPTIISAQAGIRQSESLLKVRKADYYPQLNLTGSIGTAYYNLFHQGGLGSFGHQLHSNFGEIIGLSLSYPIFNRYQTRNRVKKASNEVLYQRLDLENAKLRLREDIQNAYYNATVAQKKHQSSVKACEDSRISVEYEEIRYEEGRSSIFDLLQARQKFHKAQQDAIQAKYESMIRQKILEFYYSQK